MRLGIGHQTRDKGGGLGAASYQDATRRTSLARKDFTTMSSSEALMAGDKHGSWRTSGGHFLPVSGLHGDHSYELGTKAGPRIGNGSDEGSPGRMEDGDESFGLELWAACSSLSCRDK